MLLFIISPERMWRFLLIPALAQALLTITPSSSQVGSIQALINESITITVTESSLTSGLTISLTVDASCTVTSPNPRLTDVNGVVVFTVECSISGPFAGTATESAVVEPFTLDIYSLTITTQPSPVSPMQLLKDAISVFTVMAINGTPLSGTQVVLTSTEPSCVVTPLSDTTASDGKATFAVSCSVAGTFAFSAAKTARPASTASTSFPVYLLVFTTQPVNVRTT